MTGGRSAQAAGCTTIMVPSFVDLPADLGHVQWASLADKTLVDVRAVADRRRVGT